MKELIQQFSDMVVIDRGWSWSVIGILYLGLTLILRNWFLSPVIDRVKLLKRAHAQIVKDAYLKQAAYGWIFYLIAFLIVIALWREKNLLPITLKQLAAAVTALFCYIFSIVLHLQAVGAAGIVALRHLEKERE